MRAIWHLVNMKWYLIHTSIRVRSIVNRVMAESPRASSSNSSRQRKEYRSLITLRWTYSGPQHIDYPTWSNPIVKRTCLFDMNSLGNWMAVASPTNFPAALTHGKTWPCPRGCIQGRGYLAILYDNDQFYARIALQYAQPRITWTSCLFLQSCNILRNVSPSTGRWTNMLEGPTDSYSPKDFEVFCGFDTLLFQFLRDGAWTFQRARALLSHNDPQKAACRNAGFISFHFTGEYHFLTLLQVFVFTCDSKFFQTVLNRARDVSLSYSLFRTERRTNSMPVAIISSCSLNGTMLTSSELVADPFPHCLFRVLKQHTKEKMRIIAWICVGLCKMKWHMARVLVTLR